MHERIRAVVTIGAGLQINHLLTTTFGSLGGERPARLTFDPDATGMPMSRGYAEYNGKRLTVDQLVP